MAFSFKKIISGLLISLLGWSIYAQSSSLYNQSENLDRAIEVIEAGVEYYSFDEGYSPDKLDGLKTVVNRTREVYNELKDQDILSTERGQYFQQRYQHLLNYLSVAETFNTCLEGNEEKEVSLKIINSLAQQGIGLPTEQVYRIDCDALKIENNSDFDEFYSNVMAVAGRNNVSDVFNDLSAQSLKNYARTFANLNYSLNDGTSLEAENVVDELCQSKCDKELKDSLKVVVEEEYQNLQRQNAPRYNNSTILSHLRGSVERINTTIDDLNSEVTTRNRTLWWDAQEEGENFGPKYNHYLSTFMENVNDGPGILLLTEEMKGAIGAPRLRDETEKNDDDAYEFPRHTLPSNNNISGAKAEVFNNLKEQFKTVFNAQKQASSQNEGRIQNELEDMLISNPIAAAQILNQHPEYAHLLCSPLSEIGKSERFKERLDNGMLIGGAVLGVVLVGTGVGALVGGWLLGGTAIAGTLATAGTVAGITGFGLGVVEGGYWTSRAINHHHRINVFESAVLAGASNESSYEEAVEAIEDFRRARFDAILGLGFSAVESLTIVNEVGRLSRVLRNAEAVGDLSATERTGAMRRVSDIFDAISNNERLLVIMNRLKQVMGAEKFSKFVAGLASLSNKARISVLKFLSELSPSSIQGTIEEALVDALNKSLQAGDLTLDEANALKGYFDSENIASLNIDPQTNRFASNLEIFQPDTIRRIEDVPLTTATRVDIEADSDFSFYLRGLEDQDREFALKFIQLNRTNNVPKDDILQKLQNSVGSCRL